MKNKMNLPSITNLFYDKMDELLTEINSLQFSDLNTEEKYAEKLSFLKEKFKLEEASIDEFKVVSHSRKTERSVQSFENMFGDDREVFLINVQADAKGSDEAYLYSPGSFRHSSSWDPNIYQPVNGIISLDIRSYILDKESIKPLVNQKIALTKEFISSNNNSIRDFNLTFPQTIELKLEEYYDKIKALYS
jgi:hypothetical protein